MLSSLRAVVEEVRRSGFGPGHVRGLLSEVEFDLDEALVLGPVAWRLDPAAVPMGEPWDTLCAEGVRRIVIERGVQRREVRALVEVLALDPPMGRDRRTELWLRDLKRVHLEVVRVAPPTDPGQGRVAAARRTAARKSLDPDAPVTMLQPLPEADLRLLCADDGLAWIEEAVPLPELAPEVAGSSRPTPPPVDWRRFVHLAMAAETAARPVGESPRAPGIVVGCFDALLSRGELEELKAILAAVEACNWDEAPALRAVLLEPARRRRLAELALREAR